MCVLTTAFHAAKGLMWAVTQKHVGHLLLNLLTQITQVKNIRHSVLEEK